jgi:exonuclease SbcD
MNRLRVIYPNVMKLSYDNQRTRSLNQVGGAEEVERKSPLELFGELYEKQNGTPLSEEQTAYVTALIENIWEERT